MSIDFLTDLLISKKSKEDDYNFILVLINQLSKIFYYKFFKTSNNINFQKKWL